MTDNTPIIIAVAGLCGLTLYAYNQQNQKKRDAIDTVDVKEDKMTKTLGETPEIVEAERSEEAIIQEAQTASRRLLQNMLHGVTVEMLSNFTDGDDIGEFLNGRFGSAENELVTRGVSLEALRMITRDVFLNTDFFIENVPYLEGQNLFVAMSNTFGFLIPKAEYIRMLTLLNLAIISMLRTGGEIEATKVVLHDYFKKTFISLEAYSVTKIQYLEYDGYDTFIEGKDTSLVALATQMRLSSIHSSLSMADSATDENINVLVDDLLKDYSKLAEMFVDEDVANKIFFQGYYEAVVLHQIRESKKYDFVRAHSYYDSIEISERNRLFLERAQEFTDKLDFLEDETTIKLPDLTTSVLSHMKAMSPEELAAMENKIRADYDLIMTEDYDDDGADY